MYVLNDITNTNPNQRVQCAKNEITVPNQRVQCAKNEITV